MRHMISLLQLPAAAILATVVLSTGLSTAGVAQTARIVPPVGELGATSCDKLAATNLDSAGAPISDQFVDKDADQSLNAHLRQHPGKSTLGTGVWLCQCGTAEGCP